MLGQRQQPSTVLWPSTMISSSLDYNTNTSEWLLPSRQPRSRLFIWCLFSPADRYHKAHEVGRSQTPVAHPPFSDGWGYVRFLAHKNKSWEPDRFAVLTFDLPLLL